MMGPSSITVRELIEQLQEFDDDDIVLMGYPYGDRARTQAVLEIRSVANRPIEESAYSASGWALLFPDAEEAYDEFDDDCDPGLLHTPTGHKYVILSQDVL